MAKKGTKKVEKNSSSHSIDMLTEVKLEEGIFTELSENDDNMVVLSKCENKKIEDLNFSELYYLNNCIEMLNKHHHNVMEMNYGYDITSYNNAKNMLSDLKKYSNKVRSVIEGKIFDFKI